MDPPLGVFKTGYQIDPNPDLHFSDNENHDPIPIQ